jgi:hypothetical protein
LFYYFFFYYFFMILLNFLIILLILTIQSFRGPTIIFMNQNLSHFLPLILNLQLITHLRFNYFIINLILILHQVIIHQITHCLVIIIIDLQYLNFNFNLHFNLIHHYLNFRSDYYKYLKYLIIPLVFLRVF